LTRRRQHERCEEFTISDADMLSLLAWVAQFYGAQFGGSPQSPIAVTPAQIMLAWVHGWIELTKGVAGHPGGAVAGRFANAAD
jgi:hypothetical protein